MNWNDANITCDSAREAVREAVLAQRASDAAVEAHLASCAECRAYRAECQDLWTRLGELPPGAATATAVGAAAADARARFATALDAERSRLERRRRVRRSILLAAGLALAAALGFAAGGVRATPSAAPSTASADTLPRYLLLLYDGGAPGNVSPQQESALVAEYRAWAQGLRAAGQLVSAEKLDDGVTWLGGTVTLASGQHVGGFFLIRARDLGQARRIAETCPHLKHGGRIELRPIQPT